MTQRLLYNVSGQVLRHTPAARQATATWVLEDMRRSPLDPARTLQSGSVVVDAATEPLITTAAGPTTANARRMLVASTTDFVVGRVYEIRAASGEHEQFELYGLTTNTSLDAEHPLVGTYPVGSTIQGVELVTAAIADAVVQDEQRMQVDEPMRIVWTYANGEHHQELVRLVRHDFGDVDLSRARDDILDVFPDAATRFTRHGRDTLMPHLRVIASQLRAMLLDRHLLAEEWLTGDQGHFALVWRTLWHFAKLGNIPGGNDGLDPREWVEYCKSEFDRFWDALTTGEGGGETTVIDPVNDTIASTGDFTYRKVFGEL